MPATSQLLVWAKVNKVIFFFFKTKEIKTKKASIDNVYKKCNYTMIQKSFIQEQKYMTNIVFFTTFESFMSLWYTIKQVFNLVPQQMLISVFIQFIKKKTWLSL